MNRYTLALLAFFPWTSLAQTTDQTPPAPAAVAAPAEQTSVAPPALPLAELPPSPHATCETAMSRPFADYAATVAAVESAYPRHILFSETTVQCGKRRAMMFLMIDPTHALPARIVAVDVESIGPGKATAR